LEDEEDLYADDVDDDTTGVEDDDDVEDDTNGEEEEEDEDETKGDEEEEDTNGADDEEDDTRLRDTSVMNQGFQGMPSPLFVGLMLSELTEMVSPTGSTAVMTANM
jgi:hypothetical protein